MDINIYNEIFDSPSWDIQNNFNDLYNALDNEPDNELDIEYDNDIDKTENIDYLLNSLEDNVNIDIINIYDEQIKNLDSISAYSNIKSNTPCFGNIFEDITNKDFKIIKTYIKQNNVKPGRRKGMPLFNDYLHKKRRILYAKNKKLHK